MGREQGRAWQYILFCIASLIFLFLLNCSTIKDAERQKNARKYFLSGQKYFTEKNFDSALEEYQKVLSLSAHRSPEDEALFNIGLIYAHFGNPKKDYEKSLHTFLKILNEYPESRIVEQTKIWVGVLLDNENAMKMIEKLEKRIKEEEKRMQTLQEIEKPKQPEASSEENREARDHLIRSQKFLGQGNYEGAVSENQKVLSLSDPRSPKDEALFNLGLIYVHFGNPQKDLGKSLDYFKRLIKNFPKSTLVDQAKMWVAMLQENEGLNQVIQKLKQIDIEIEEMKRKRTP